MTYAEIIYRGKSEDNPRDEFYLEFYGNNSKEITDEYNQELLSFYNKMKKTAMFDIYFSGKYLISRHSLIKKSIMIIAVR